MFVNHSPRRLTTFILLAVVLFVSVAFVAPASAAGPTHKSSAPAYWLWDSTNPVGQSRLVRTENGLNAVYQTTGLPSGQAMTLWFIVFNNPFGCSTSPCSVPADLFNPAAAADFLWGGGRVTGKNKTTFAGHLAVGDTSGSGMIDIGSPDLAIGLSNPMGAEVHLAIHSHGPALTGQDLIAQLTSFTGGCEVFLGTDGTADGPEDVPSEGGQCSTIQGSLHQP